MANNCKCGNEDLQVLCTNDDEAYVYCHKCKAKGPLSYCEGDAIVEWNKITETSDGLASID